MDFELIKFIMFFLLVVLLIIIIPISISYFLYHWLAKTKFKKLAFLLPTFVIGIATFLIYTELFPRNSFYSIKFIFFLLLIVILIIGIPISISYFLYRWLTKTKFKKLAFLLPTLIIGTVTFFIYTAFYPRDSFYEDDFTTHTGIKLPSSADILDKAATYPDFNGDYWSAAIIQLDESDYRKLKMKLSMTPYFIEVTEPQKIGITNSYYQLTKDIKESEIEVTYKNTKKEWFRVAFLTDKKRIIFELNGY